MSIENICENIFNSEFDGIPTGLADILPFKSNLRGEIVKAFFITASGAEGITLKNVRQLHIVEHHWSEIRVDQVIEEYVDYIPIPHYPSMSKKLMYTNTQQYLEILNCPKHYWVIMEKLLMKL